MARPVADERGLLQRLLDAPQLAHVVPKLQPDVLHRVIQHCGLEDCAEIVALATPAQLMRVFDVDLWRSGRPGVDEQFDPDRFGVWLEVLMASGADVAAQKLMGVDVDLVVTALAQHLRVFDRMAVSSYTTLDGEEIQARRRASDALSCEIGGYFVEAKRTESWDVIVDLLTSLDAAHPAYLDRVMRGCRGVSSEGFEVDGLDDLMTDDEQQLFDLGVERERRREQSGYVTPAQAGAFLRMARQTRLDAEAPPPPNPLVLAYQRATEESAAQPLHDGHGGRGGSQMDDERQDLLSSVSSVAESSVESSVESSDAAVASVLDVLIDAGIMAPPVRALIEAPQPDASGDDDAPSAGADDGRARFTRIRAFLQSADERDEGAFAARTAELAYLANTLVAGCSVYGRPFTEREASDAALAICNLGLENWPRQWAEAQDLVTVFQIGFTVLHDEVCMFAAERLVDALGQIQCVDEDTQAGIDGLRLELTKQWRAGTPWHVSETLDVIMTLDTPAWAVLVALISECPVVHAAMGGSRRSSVHTVGASAFELIAENRQIAEVRQFLASLPDTLRG